MDYKEYKNASDKTLSVSYKEEGFRRIVTVASGKIVNLPPRIGNLYDILVEVSEDQLPSFDVSEPEEVVSEDVVEEVVPELVTDEPLEVKEEVIVKPSEDDVPLTTVEDEIIDKVLKEKMN